MHWVIQENLHREDGHSHLLETLQRAGLPYSEHKIIPFSGDLIPDVYPDGNVIVMGTYSMCILAKQRKWEPGCFDLSNSPHNMQMEMWGEHMLNSDCTVGTFGTVAPNIEQFFIRPTADSKCFAGVVLDLNELRGWQHRVVQLEKDDGSGLRAGTEVFWASPKKISEEYRLWVVEDSIITSSRYNPASKNVPQDALDFGALMSLIWSPQKAYVMDVCLCQGDWKIIEINTLNASGFYHADLNALVLAIENL